MDASVNHFDLNLNEFEVSDVLNKIKIFMKLQEKNAKSLVILGTFKKRFIYGLEIYLRCNKTAISIKLYEFDLISIVVDIKVNLDWFDIQIVDTAIKKYFFAIIFLKYTSVRIMDFF